MRRHWVSLKSVGIIWLFFWFFSALGVWIAQGNTVFHYDLEHALLGPSPSHLLGCDAFGRELLPLILRASLLSIAFAAAVTFAVTLAAIFGAGSLALAPGPLRNIGLRLLEGWLAFPALIIALGWSAIRGPGWIALTTAIFVGELPGFTRLLCLRAREVLSEDYIEAAVGLGADRGRLLSKYIAPELIRLGAVKFPLLFAHALMAEATLSFLGIGAPIGQDTWGSLLAQGKDYLIEAPHLAVVTGLPLALTLLALQGFSERFEFSRDA